MEWVNEKVSEGFSKKPRYRDTSYLNFFLKIYTFLHGLLSVTANDKKKV